LSPDVQDEDRIKDTVELDKPKRLATGSKSHCLEFRLQAGLKVLRRSRLRSANAQEEKEGRTV
jgi:hypothetical protein